MGFEVSIGPRIRKSPFFDATVAAGVVSFSAYNHMYFPVSYGDPMGEYWRLVNDVAMWDVSVQRQVQLRGPDAHALAQAVCARDLTEQQIGQGKYTPMVDHSGAIINDPLTLRVAKETWWISIADLDVLQWCRAIAGERLLEVEVSEPDVSPLAVQGPKAEDTVAALLGDLIRDLRFFRYTDAEVDGIPLKVGRAGWSKQGGFELYLLDGSRGTDLWNLVAEAGAPFGIGPGAPNPIERVESGLYSFYGDNYDGSDPFEVGLGRFVDLDADIDFIGKAALLARRARGLRHELVGIVFEGPPVSSNEDCWAVTRDGDRAGTVTVACYSPRVDGGANIALALMDVPHNDPGTAVVVETAAGPAAGVTATLPFL